MLTAGQALEKTRIVAPRQCHCRASILRHGQQVFRMRHEGAYSHARRYWMRPEKCERVGMPRMHDSAYFRRIGFPA
jgi:hypothetical protein